MRQVDEKATAATRARYARIAPFYDLMEVLPEARFRIWRERFWAEVNRYLPSGARLLEVGIGTGKNMPYWPADVNVTGVDLTQRMAKQARQRGEELGLAVEIQVADVQRLDFPADSFDAAVGTFVFCSVPDPILGLNELARTVRAGGPVLLMEHVRAEDPTLGRLMDLLNPLFVRLMGPNINRDTVGNVMESRLGLEEVQDLGAGGIFKIIRAEVPEKRVEVAR